jgi:hypothetical protein
MALRRVEDVVVDQDAREDDGAGHRDGDADDQPFGGADAECKTSEQSQERGEGNLANGAGDGNSPYGPQVAEVKVKAHAEHKQDDANLSKLPRGFDVGAEARSVGSQNDASQQISDNGGQSQPLCDEPQDERQAEADREVHQEGNVVHRRFAGGGAQRERGGAGGGGRIQRTRDAGCGPRL